MKKTDLAYIAGLFDGEGSIGIYLNGSRKRKWYRLHCAVALTDEFLIHLLQMHFGGEFYTCKKRKDTYRTAYRWTLHSKKAGEFLLAILPYLKIKKPQAEIALNFQNKMVRKVNEGNKPLSEKENALREAQSILLKRLKKC